MAVRVDGLASLRRKLGLLTDAEKRVARIEVKRAALNVEAGAKRRAPVDTGRLRASVTHEARDEGLSAVVGTNVEYAPHQEFGTRYQSGTPFLFPAFEEERPKFVRRITAALDGAHRDVAK